MGSTTEYRGVDDATDERPVSERVVTGVAAVTGTDPMDLPPLYGIVDPDALDALFRTPVSGTPRDGGRVQFEMAGCAVTVDSHGTVDVTRPGDARSDPLVEPASADDDGVHAKTD